ncbi:MAG: MIP/aquaporin family protein [Vagococcus sp.]
MSGDTLQIFSEFLGTLILVLLGNGVVAAVSLNKSKAQGAGWVVITLGWGAAVTLGMAVAGNIGWNMVAPFIIAQILGGIVGAALVWVTYMPHWEATKDEATILGTFSTGPAIRSPFSNMITELIGTFVLVFALLAFGRTTFADGMNPLIVGVLILSLGLSLGGPTGYAINPARDLGPRIAHQLLPIANKGDSDWGYAWVPVVGPMLGGLLAALVWGMIP